MGNLITIDLEAKRNGKIKSRIANDANLDKNAYRNALAFSAPLFLSHQLSSLTFKTGLNLVTTIEGILKDKVNGKSLDYYPLDHFYRNVWN